MNVHYCGYASQPYITIFCEDKSYYVYARDTSLPEGIYNADGDDNKPIYFTFDKKKSNCQCCIEKLGES